MSHCFSLSQLGWRAFFSQQLTLEDLDRHEPARVAGVHRNRIQLLTEHGEHDAITSSAIDFSSIAVGDWVLLERDSPRIARILERASLLSRIAAGSERREQFIAANLDTLFIATSCNQDFNPSRIERYLSVALDSDVEPVILLTKSDLTDAAEIYVEQTRIAAPRIAIFAVNAHAPDSLIALQPWLGSGRTVAFVGSSGVGKSTLVNTLIGTVSQATASIREDDARGRHTTTSRQLISMPQGAWLIDTPGMRELKIGALEHGVDAAFADVEALARACRYRDCSHENDEGCALRAATARGEMDERRFRNYLKLLRESANAALTVRERRERDRHFGRQYKSIQQEQRRKKGN
jgi:ribosome biogenesis GTPase